MSIDKTDQAVAPADTASRPAPLLRTLGAPDAAVCVDGFCEVPEIDVDTTNTDTTNTRGAGK